MAMESPLFLTKLECPICGTVNEFETIRVGAYTEGERLTDFCPSVIKWRNHKYQKYHPLLFFTATCSNCFYSREFNSKYKNWAADNNFRSYRLTTLKEKHLSALAEENSFIHAAAEKLDQENYPDETAVLKLLLTIFDERLTDHPSQLDLGRFYLRIAWLFRHMSLDIDDGERDSKDRENRSDIETAVTDIRNWWAGLKRNLDYARQAVNSHFSGNESDWGPGAGEYNEKLSRLAALEESGRSVVQELERLLGASRPGPETSVSVEGSEYFDEGSFELFLDRLARLWNGVPRNERDALQFAVGHYMEAFEAGREIARGNQSIQAAYLIAELSRQIGDHDTARKYFNNTIRMGQEFINEIKGDRTRTALARKILELALAQGKKNLAEAKAG